MAQAQESVRQLAHVLIRQTIINHFFDVLSAHCYEIKASIWASLRTRFVLPNIKKKPAKQFPALRTEVKSGSGGGSLCRFLQ
jgi:hypothetical protein